MGLGKVTLISPRIAIQKNDFLGSGVPYWPIELATLTAFLTKRGISTQVADLFGCAPARLTDCGTYYLQGLPVADAFASNPALRDADLFIVFAISYMSHAEVLQIVADIRKFAVIANVKIAVLENSQAVTAYSLTPLAPEFFAHGADVLLCGEVYWNWDAIEGYLSDPQNKECPPNVISPTLPLASSVKRITQKNPHFEIPAWEKFPLINYWKLPYSHGPKTRRFLPVLTSRGCPYPCDFCVVPEINDTRWRGRTAEAVVEEMLTLRDRFGVSDFQWEDLNPTVQTARVDNICELLIQKNAGIRFYLVSGTKAETVKLSSLPRWAAAGCKYISISPESGSNEVLKAIGKPFDHAHGLAVVRECKRLEISTQACFIVGHPAEKDADHQKSCEYLGALLQAGLDEAAFFIVAPFAGSKLYAAGRLDLEQNSGEMVSFSPTGRPDWELVSGRRKQLIELFFRGKLKQGGSLWRQGWRSIRGVPQTKMENLPRRMAYIYGLLMRNTFNRYFGSRA
jgi:anaerobic magnesium-protoporphyrin IX monomethyl ester cyclase